MWQCPAALQQRLQQGAQGSISWQLRQALAGAVSSICAAHAACPLDSVAEHCQRQSAGAAHAGILVTEGKGLQCRNWTGEGERMRNT